MLSEKCEKLVKEVKELDKKSSQKVKSLEEKWAPCVLVKCVVFLYLTRAFNSKGMFYQGNFIIYYLNKFTYVIFKLAH